MLERHPAAPILAELEERLEEMAHKYTKVHERGEAAGLLEAARVVRYLRQTTLDLNP